MCRFYLIELQDHHGGHMFRLLVITAAAQWPLSSAEDGSLNVHDDECAVNYNEPLVT